MEWARARWEHGLGGPGFPWQEGEQAWLLAGQLESQAEQGREAACDEPGGDVPAQQLADPDSRWVQCDGLRVHYKLSLPLVRCRLVDRGGWGRMGAIRAGRRAGRCSRQIDGHLDPSRVLPARTHPTPPLLDLSTRLPCPAMLQGQRPVGDTALVLVHSFGGGVFSWRHMQQPLADACGLPVLAFDRPGFGVCGAGGQCRVQPSQLQPCSSFIPFRSWPWLGLLLTRPRPCATLLLPQA